MGSFGFSLSMIASLSPTLTERRLNTSMGCVSTIDGSNLSSVSLVSSPVTKRRAQDLVFRSSASPSMEATPDSDVVGVVSSAKTKKVSLFFLLLLRI